MGRNFWIILGIILIGSAGLIYFVSSNGSPAVPSTTKEALQINDKDHVEGNKNASVVVVEYSDFQCPACGAFHPITKQVIGLYSDKVAFVYRHFPLVSIHQNAMAASRAAEAAGNQGKFWEMHNILFERQRSWSNTTDTRAIFEGYATELGLNMDKYRKDVASEETLKTITTSISLGTNLGVNATPTFFINGKKIGTPRSVDEFKTAIQSALETASSR